MQEQQRRRLPPKPAQKPAQKPAPNEPCREREHDPIGLTMSELHVDPNKWHAMLRNATTRPDDAALRRVARELDQRDLLIVVMGGSVTLGVSCETREGRGSASMAHAAGSAAGSFVPRDVPKALRGDACAWPAQLQVLLRALFAPRRHVVRNVGYHGVSLQLGKNLVRSSNAVQGADLIIANYDINDMAMAPSELRHAAEDFVRQARARARALLFAHMATPALPPNDEMVSWLSSHAGGDATAMARDAPRAVQAIEADVLAYYDVPALSYTDFAWCAYKEEADKRHVRASKATTASERARGERDWQRNYISSHADAEGAESPAPAPKKWPPQAVSFFGVTGVVHPPWSFHSLFAWLVARRLVDAHARAAACANTSAAETRAGEAIGDASPLALDTEVRELPPSRFSGDHASCDQYGTALSSIGCNFNGCAAGARALFKELRVDGTWRFGQYLEYKDYGWINTAEHYAKAKKKAGNNAYVLAGGTLGAAGSTISFKLDGCFDDASNTTTLAVGFLKSYEGMGKVMLSARAAHGEHVNLGVLSGEWRNQFSGYYESAYTFSASPALPDLHHHAIEVRFTTLDRSKFKLLTLSCCRA